MTADLERAQANVKVLTFATESFAASVANQNAAIDRMQEEAAARKRAADAAVAKAKSAAVYERTAMNLMSRTAPSDERTATKQMLDEVIR